MSNLHRVESSGPCMSRSAQTHRNCLRYRRPVVAFKCSRIRTFDAALLGRGRTNPKRSGVALIVLLLGMAVAAAIFLSVLKLVAVERQSVELQQRRAQAEWLAESAIERAAAKLAADEKYNGETWAIPAKELGGRDGGIVAIRIDEIAGKADQRTVHIEADFPDHPFERVREIRDRILHLSKGTKP